MSATLAYILFGCGIVDCVFAVVDLLAIREGQIKWDIKRKRGK